VRPSRRRAPFGLQAGLIPLLVRADRRVMRAHTMENLQTKVCNLAFRSGPVPHNGEELGQACGRHRRCIARWHATSVDGTLTFVLTIRCGSLGSWNVHFWDRRCSGAAGDLPWHGGERRREGDVERVPFAAPLARHRRRAAVARPDVVDGRRHGTATEACAQPAQAWRAGRPRTTGQGLALLLLPPRAVAP